MVTVDDSILVVFGGAEDWSSVKLGEAEGPSPSLGSVRCRELDNDVVVGGKRSVTF